ncbi:hypothetical protein [uncultured Jatrophihabitans sp.]|uniref:hypothetical protein n=1 Tax=uncultured Jatrophihabitans sp. TaxID=1610747 RepID=UPI0035CABD44
MSDQDEAVDHRQLGITLFNSTWRLIEQDDRSRADDDRLAHMAHASRYHWGEVGAPANLARGEWLCSRVYALLGRAEPSRHHAERALAICVDNELVDWDLAFCHEALARAAAVADDLARARVEIERALAVEIAEDEDRALLLGDLATVPGVDVFW